MEKSKTKTYIMVLFFFIGLMILFYPSISNYTNNKIQSKAIDNYENLISESVEEDYSKYFEDGKKYNKELMKIKNPIGKKNLNIGNAQKILDVSKTGMIGYLSINKIHLDIPIYYGTSDKILSKGSGILEGTSLPIGGKGTHSVLSAHRGLPSSKLFTDLDKLEKGDTFIVKVLDQIITYEVDNISIVKPKDISLLSIDKNADYITLMTCTPYGINSHRLLVRGHRVENAKSSIYISTEAFLINKLIVMPIMCLPILFLWLLLIAFAPRKTNINLTLKYVYPTQYKLDMKKKGI